MKNPFIIQGGWYRPTTNTIAEFRKRVRREPTEDEKNRLKYVVKYTMQGLAASNESTYENGFGILEYYLKNPARGLPPKKMVNAGGSISEAARARVQAHIHAYNQAHKSGFAKIGSFISDAVAVAGAPLHAVAHVASAATGALSDLVGKIPIVGGPLHAAFDAALVGPFRVADGVMSGERLDKVALKEIKSAGNVIKEVGPYAQMVISNVPSVGSGISGVIGAGLAIADGQPITEALKRGLKEMAPGGPIGAALISVTTDVMSGKPVDQIAINAIPLPSEQKLALSHAIEITKRVANGDNVGKVALDHAEKTLSEVATQLGPNVAKSLKIGLAVGQAEQLQSIMKEQATSLQVIAKLGDEAQKIINVDPVVAQAAKIVPDGKVGFMIGVGLMRKQINRTEFRAIREKLKGADRKAFDVATSLHIGRVVTKAPPQLKGVAGYYTTIGLRNAKPAQQKAIIKNISKHPEMKKAAIVAAKQLNETLWQKIKRFVGFPEQHAKKVA